MRKIKKIPSFFATFLATGCIGYEGDLPDTRLDVNDELRIACIDYAISDSEIAAMLAAAESDRLNGISFSDEMNTWVIGVCPKFPIDLQLPCTICGSAVISQVYGK